LILSPLRLPISPPGLGFERHRRAARHSGYQLHHSKRVRKTGVRACKPRQIAGFTGFLEARAKKLQEMPYFLLFLLYKRIALPYHRVD